MSSTLIVDVENLRHFPDAFALGEPVILSEKVHGTSGRIGMVEGEWMAGSMGLRRKRPADDAMSLSTYWFPYTLASGVYMPKMWLRCLAGPLHPGL
jgi:hypothetical protein